MKKILCSVALLALAACGQQKPAETAAAPAAPPPAAEEPAAAPAPVAEKKAEPLPPLPPAERAKWYQDCWTAFNGKDWNKFSACWADNATAEQVDSGMPMLKGKSEVLDKGAKQFAASFPDATGEHQLTLVNGNTIVSVVLVRGTNKGPLMTPMGELPATNKKIGAMVGHVIESTPDGRQAQAERFYMDGASQMGQLGLNPAPHRKQVETGWAKKEVVIASGSDTEKANLEIAKKQVEAFNKHDVPGILALAADDFVFSDIAAPQDTVGKPAIKKSHDEFFKGFPDVSLTVDKTWAAGDYVVAEGTLSGTNTGDMPSMKLKKTGKKVSNRFLNVIKIQGGKIKNQWIFDNGMAFAMQLGLGPKADPKAAKPAPGAAAKPDAKPAPAAAAPAAKPGATPATPATPAAKPGATPATPATPADAKAGKPATPATPATPPAKK